MITDANGKKVPERMCVVCRNHASKDGFLRVVKTKDGRIELDTDKKCEGRGAYICANEKCISEAKKRNSFARAFKMNVDMNIYTQLEECIK